MGRYQKIIAVRVDRDTAGRLREAAQLAEDGNASAVVRKAIDRAATRILTDGADGADDETKKRIHQAG